MDIRTISSKSWNSAYLLNLKSLWRGQNSKFKFFNFDCRFWKISKSWKLKVLFIQFFSYFDSPNIKISQKEKFFQEANFQELSESAIRIQIFQLWNLTSCLPEYFLLKFFRIVKVKSENRKLENTPPPTCRKNLSQFGHPHPSLLQLAHSPTSNFDTILMTFLGWFGDNFEKILRQFWVDVGSILRRMLGRFRDNFGTILGTILGQFWDNFGGNFGTILFLIVLWQGVAMNTA